RRDIEKIGLEKFITECRLYVSQTSAEWNWYIDRVGRWVDMENAYRTMDKDFMESVIWVFKSVYDKGLVYKGKRVSLYCPHCGTPISNFEVAMDNSYREVSEEATTYKYKLTDENKIKLSQREKKFAREEDENLPVYLLAWSTTPWNKLATPALAVNPDLEYVRVRQGNEFYVLAKTTLSMLTQDKPYKKVASIKGRDLEGLHFEPHFDFYELPEEKQKWIVVADDFVTAEEGTGIVTLAVYGEDDFRVMKEKDIALIEHVDDAGYLTIDREPWKGMYYLKSNEIVNEDLGQRNLIYREDPHTHTVPDCWRCGTRLMFAPQDAWFLKVSELKEKLLKTNENIYWFPHYLKEGRFKKGIESAPDWCISRSRYWATPMPVWECQTEGCHERKVVGSVAEIEKLSGKKVTDLHRPYIDQHVFSCEKCGGTMKRIPDVLDCWMESGSMPYGERHYPFENKKEFEANFPADFVCEYIAQTRAWFYVMHVLSNALFERNAFKNVITTGVIKGTDGRKMSKSYGNYPDPKRVIETYGGDALRLYLMSSPVMSGENLNINEEDIKEQNQRTLVILWNTYKYFVTYANLHQFTPQLTDDSKTVSNILDKWILLRLEELKTKTSHYLEAYNIPKAVRLIRPFVNDLSTWYIRRSRDRFVNNDKDALKTLYKVLMELSLVMAPTTPFITEELYQNLKLKDQPESVHLNYWPKQKKLTKEDREFLKLMDIVREISSIGNAVRKEKQIPLRQPLSKVMITSTSEKLPQGFLEIIKDELNVKAVEWQTKPEAELSLYYDTKITSELKAEGEVRRLIRAIQQARKKAGVERDALVSVTLPQWPKEYEDEIKHKAMVRDIREGDSVTVMED
ncbi:MAG: isoleucine--tRNA ligase, partial [Patescibacteria group bacterium]